MSDSSPGPAPPPQFFAPLSAVYPASTAAAAAVPALSPTRRRATSVPAQREADVTLSASPSASPSPSPPSTAARAALLTSQPPTPLATLSYQQSEHVPTLLNAKLRSPPPPPLPPSVHDSPARPAAVLSLFPRTPPPSQPSAGAVRLLLPSNAATPFASLFPASSPHSAPSQSVYHQQRLFGRQRHRVVQGELLQLYLVVPHSQHVLFPWLFASATPPPPPSAASPLPSPPVVVSEVSPCRFHVDVRLRGASVRTEDGRDEADASPSLPSVPSVPVTVTPPSAASVPQPPTSLSLSSAGSLTSPAEPANATSGWSRFATRFGRKSGPSTEKDNNSNPPAGDSAPHVPPPPPPATAPHSSSSPVLSPQSAPPVGADGSSLGRLEPRRTRSLGMMSPTHIPPHITVASHSAFQHEPPFHLLPHRPTSLTCSPALHHSIPADGSGCYQFTLSNGDVVLALETIMHASSDGHVWLEVEVHSPTSHQSLLSSLSLPAVSVAASAASSLSPQLPSMAASLRSFMFDHRVLRLPPPHPLAGCLLLISHAVHVHAGIQQVNDRVLAEVRVAAADDVQVESVELLVESAHWLSSALSVPVALSSLFSLSQLPVTLPLTLHACEEYHFLFTLEPLVSMSQSMGQLRAEVLKAMEVSEVGGGTVDGRLLTTCVVRWRSKHASTAITSQYDVSWQLPLHLHDSTATSSASAHASLSSPGVAVPPVVILSHPPRVQLHSVFAISVTLHNTSLAALTCTLQLPSDDIQLTSPAASPAQPAALVQSHSALVASSQSTPANLLSPIGGFSSTAAHPFSPVHGFHFPFHSLASRLPATTRATSSRSHQPQPNGHTSTHHSLPANEWSSEQQPPAAQSDEDDQAAQLGLVCLDGEVEVGVLDGGGRRSVGLQCVAVRCGFVRLPRLLLHVKELDASFVCRNDGVLLVDAGA